MSDFRWAWLDRVEAEDSPASPGARHLANVMVRHFVQQGSDVCWPGRRRLNALMNVGSDTVEHRLNELEHFGFLRSQPRGNGRSHLRYLLIPESFETGVPAVPVRRRGGRRTGVPGVPVTSWFDTKKAACPQYHTGVPGVPEPLLTPLSVQKEEARARVNGSAAQDDPTRAWERVA